MEDLYEQIGKPLNSQQISKALRTINFSKKVEIVDQLPDGRLNHIVLKGTNIPIGYIGADNQIEKVTPKGIDSSEKRFRKGHKYLETLHRILQ